MVDQSQSLTDNLIGMIEAFGAERPTSFGLGELYQDLIKAIQDFSGGGGGVISVSGDGTSVSASPTTGHVLVSLENPITTPVVINVPPTGQALTIQFTAESGSGGIELIDAENLVIGGIGSTGGFKVAGDRIQVSHNETGPWLALDGETSPSSILFPDGPSGAYGAGFRIWNGPGLPTDATYGLLAGTASVNDQWYDSATGIWYICTVAGTPGTWIPYSSSIPINAQTGSYTPVATDVGKAIEVNSSSAAAVTIEPNVFPATSSFEVAQLGLGAVSLVGAPGMTLLNKDGLTLSGENAACSIRFRTSSNAIVNGELTNPASALPQTIIYDTAGNSTWVAPPGVTSVTVNGTLTTVTPGTTYPIVVGTPCKFNGVNVSGTTVILTYTYNPGVVMGVTPGSGYLTTMESLSSGALAAQIALLVSIGCKYIRIWNPWSSGASFQNPYDGVIAAAIAGGLKVLVILHDISGGGAKGSWGTGTGTFAATCTNAVAHGLSQGVHLYEIGNEVNLGGSGSASAWTSGTVTPATYVACLQSCYAIIKAGDPTAQVLFTGMAEYGQPTGATAPATNLNAVDFLHQCYTAGAHNYFDIMNNHTYNYGSIGDGFTDGGFPQEVNPYNPWYAMTSTTPSLRSLMVSNGDSAKQIWITEFGVPTGTAGGYTAYTQNAQALTMSETVQLAAATSYIGPIFPYDFYDSSSDDFGLYTTTGAAKLIVPIYQAGNA